MKRTLYTFLAVLGCLLFLWGLTTLVETVPAEAAEPAAPQPPVQAALLPPQTAESAPAAEADRGAPRQDVLCRTAADTPLPPAPMADGNGTPMRAERYIRAAWQAFPPEAAHG